MSALSIAQRPDGLYCASGSTMGMQFTLVFPALDGTVAQEHARVAYLAMDAVDADMSVYKPQSDISRFNGAEPGVWVAVGDNLVEVVLEAKRIGDISIGVFDIAVFDLVQAFGFGPPSENDGAEETPSSARGHHEDIICRTDPPALLKRRPLRIDLGGIAKGFGVDEAARIFAERGVDDFLVEIGGEIRAAGVRPDGQPWRVGLELPLPGRRIVHDRIPLKNCAIATSGVYRQYREDGDITYSHTIDPRTNAPVSNDTLCVTVAAETCMRADALATVLMVLQWDGAIAYAERHSIAASILRAEADGYSEYRTNAFDKRFSKANAKS